MQTDYFGAMGTHHSRYVFLLAPIHPLRYNFRLYSLHHGLCGHGC